MLNQCNPFVPAGENDLRINSQPNYFISTVAMKVESPTASIHEVENDHEGSSKGGETAAPQDGETAVPQDGCPDLHIATGTEISLTDTDNGDPHTQYYDL